MSLFQYENVEKSKIWYILTHPTIQSNKEQKKMCADNTDDKERHYRYCRYCIPLSYFRSTNYQYKNLFSGLFLNNPHRLTRNMLRIFLCGQLRASDIKPYSYSIAEPEPVGVGAGVKVRLRLHLG